MSSKNHIVKCCRRTSECEILVIIGGPDRVSSIDTPIPMLSHLLTQFAFYSGLSLRIQAVDLLETDDHHLVEDLALTLGQALHDWLGDRSGRARFGQRMLPMDDALATVAIDIGGRPWLQYEARFQREFVGKLATENLAHFFHSLSQAAGFTLHLRVRGRNAHHMAEAAFKALGMALNEALQIWPDGVRSTKGVLS